MISWLSVMGDKFNCKACKRKNMKSFTCPLTNHIDKEEIQVRIEKAESPSSMPLIFKAEAAGICPRTLISPFAQLVAQSYRWWEKGQLGIDYINSPAWVDTAFTMYSNELGKAQQFARQLDKGK